MADPSPSLVDALRQQYALDREVGRGGMATVYLARDLRQGQAVAVKVMHKDLGSAIGAERFRREMAIAGSLTHPGIVPLQDSGTAGEVLYYVMPFVEGETLFARLERDKRLPVKEALRITREVAAALGYAHQKGILHRDVKPENILLSSEHALVGDFGLARAIGAADSKKLTETGVLLGTVLYMSPEQLREDDLDQRADIYSLGCILYEMLTGGPPYTGWSLSDMVTRILKAPIPSAQKVNPEVTPAIDQAIARALAKATVDRFQTMEEFSAALPQ
jgi:serine/threonine-protein kinase